MKVRMVDDVRPEISVVVPVYRGQPFLIELHSRICTSLDSRGLSFELILVNDASPDLSWDEIAKICARDPRVKGVSLSRNFGQHAAITAGLSIVSGRWVVVMDCDLQDRPEDIPALHDLVREGYHSVFAQRTDRRDSWLKRMQSRFFYALFGYLTNSKIDHSVANFGIYSRSVISSVLAMGDYVRFFPAMVQWVGYKCAYLPVVHAERPSGRSSYSLGALLRLSAEIVISFSDKPIKLALSLGLVISLCSLVLAFGALVAKLLNNISVSGYASLFISIWFLGGVLLMFLGLVGVYTAKMFDQVKARPVFLVAEALNHDRSEDVKQN